ncbi:MAG: DUF3386 family protein [Gemmataceae bacterium]|nr:DUF3386 family protein [Gemmataceae bacterium]
MKRLLACLTLLALALPAPAHFLWLLPQKDRVIMVFSDELAPDENVPITKVAKTKFFGRGADGVSFGVKAKEDKHSYLIEAVAKTPYEIAGICQYGVLAKGKADPFLLNYYARAVVGDIVASSIIWDGWSELPLEVLPAKSAKRTVKVLWQGKPAAKVEVVLTVPGVEAPVTKTSDEKGLVELETPKETGIYGIRARFVENKAGELGGEKYKEIRHYSTFTFVAVKKGQANNQPVSAPFSPLLQGDESGVKGKADPAATKLLADARAARAVWKDFPGFSADLEVNAGGKLHKGGVEVSAQGKVTLKLDAEGLKEAVRREITSLVAHRLPGGSLDTPCAFTDDNLHHPLGRAIKVLNDELHSSYRIRDRQIIEVNRQMQDARFTITVLENQWTKEKQYLPSAYVVNTWDAKSGVLKSSVSHHNAWTRIGAFDLPTTTLTVRVTPEGIEAQRLTFSNYKVNGQASAQVGK